MAHGRKRNIEELFVKRLKASPMTILNGARQVGRSFLARELLKDHCKNFHYLTLDNFAQLQVATLNPTHFVSQFPDDELIVIDGAQKSPPIFEPHQ